MKTRREIEELVGKLTDNNELVNLVGRVGSDRRVGERREHIRAALIVRLFGVDIDTEEDYRSAKLALLMADLIGVGGRANCALPGAMPRTTTLLRGGSGRRYARDGSAWQDAVEREVEALDNNNVRLTPLSLIHLRAATSPEWTLPLCLRCVEALARADEFAPCVREGNQLARVGGDIRDYIDLAGELHEKLFPDD